MSVTTALPARAPAALAPIARGVRATVSKGVVCHYPLVVGMNESAGGGNAVADGLVFTRSGSRQTIIDHEGLIHELLTDEIGLQGARREYNYGVGISGLVSSESLVGWALTGGLTLGGDDQTVSGITGGTDIIQANMNSVSPDGQSWGFLVKLSSSETGDIRIQVKSNGGTSSSSQVDVNVSPTPKWYWVTHTFPGGNLVSQPRAAVRGTGIGVSTITVHAYHFAHMSGRSLTAPPEYVSFGIESTPYHGANVDSVKYFTTTNENSVVDNVVVEGVGNPITGIKGYLSEPSVSQQLPSTLVDSGFTLNNVQLVPAEHFYIGDVKFLRAESTISASTFYVFDNTTNYSASLLTSGGTSVLYTVAKADEVEEFQMSVTNRDGSGMDAFFHLITGTVGSPAGTDLVSYGMEELSTGVYLCWLVINNGTGTSAINHGIYWSNGSQSILANYPVGHGMFIGAMGMLDQASYVSSAILQNSATRQPTSLSIPANSLLRDNDLWGIGVIYPSMSSTDTRTKNVVLFSAYVNSTSQINVGLNTSNKAQCYTNNGTVKNATTAALTWQRNQPIVIAFSLSSNGEQTIFASVNKGAVQKATLTGFTGLHPDVLTDVVDVGAYGADIESVAITDFKLHHESPSDAVVEAAIAKLNAELP